MAFPRVQIGEFELDPAAYELRRLGRPIRLERIPMELLLLLVSRRGELVTRAEIIEKLWGAAMFISIQTPPSTRPSGKCARHFVMNRRIPGSCKQYQARVSLHCDGGSPCACRRLGDKDKALEWLNRAYSERDVYLTEVAIEPALAPLRSHPQFSELLRRVGVSR
jgi:hypothetical protein